MRRPSWVLSWRTRQWIECFDLEKVYDLRSKIEYGSSTKVRNFRYLPAAFPTVLPLISGSDILLRLLRMDNHMKKARYEKRFVSGRHRDQ